MKANWQTVSGARTKPAAIFLVAVVVGSALGYWAYGEHQKREQYKAVVALVTDTSRRLRDALSIDARPASANQPDTVRKLGDHATAVNRRLQDLHGRNASPAQEWVSAAENYVSTAWQILLYQTSSHQYHLQVSGGMQALQDHMLKGDRRLASWIPEAIRAKEQLEKDYRDYQRAVDAFGRLLESYPDAKKKLAPHVDATLLVDETLVREARERALGTLKQITEEFEKTRQLESYR